MEKKNTKNIDLLPGEITLDIFTRLPYETVLHCKRVCKTWRNLLRSCKHFPYMHLRRQQLDDSKVSYILTCAQSLAYAEFTFFDLYYGEYAVKNLCSNNIQSSIVELSTVEQIHRPPYPFFGFVLGSCNGLIMCQPYGRETKTLSLSNPMTREYLNIPIQEKLVVCGFGYDTSTRAYKVVRVDPCSHRDWVTDGANYKVHVHTIGSGTEWRRKRNIRPQLRCPRFGGFIGIPSNGALHWLDEKYRIWAFDLADQEFRCIPSPQFTGRAGADHFELQLLGNCLSMVHYKKSITFMDIWLLKRDNKKRKRNVSDGYSTVNEKLEYYQLSSWNWSKEFSLTEVSFERHAGLVKDVVDPFALTKSGELLLFCRTRNIIYRYRGKSSTSPNLDREKLDNVDGHGCTLYLFNAIPYNKSCVSLKDLGKDVKIFD